MTGTHAQRRRGRIVAAAIVVVALLGVVLFATGLLSSADEPTSAGPAPSPTAGDATTPAPSPAPQPVVAIDEVRTMPYTPVWNPPDGGESFWQIVDPDEGYPADGGTDYLLAHACRDEACAGDEIRTLVAGDRMTYDGAEYVVDRTLEIDKTEIGEQDIWTHEDGRLVVITCVLDTATDEYRQNDIVVAHRAG